MRKMDSSAVPIPVPQPSTSSEDKMEMLSNSFQKTIQMFQKETEIALVAEQLRQRLHNARLIRDRRRHLYTYPNCFYANEVIAWLIHQKEVVERETAIHIMQVLVNNGFIHHACDDYTEYKDEPLLYRFRGDDGTLNFTEHIRTAFRSQRLFERMMEEEDCILKVHEEGSKQYKRAFIGSQMVDWLIKHDEVATRKDGEQFCKRMLEYGIIQHVSGQYQFSDSDKLFRFAINVRRRRKLTEVIETPTSSNEPRPDSPDSPFCLRKLNEELPRAGFVCANDPGPPPPPVIKRSSSGGASSYQYQKVDKPIRQLTLELKRQVTSEELKTPGDKYILKTLCIEGDAVGWGFMARGSGPTFIYTMDVDGPAAQAGMKACQFIKSVNGINCLRLDYHTIYKHIVAGPRVLIMEVLEPVEGTNCLVPVSP